MDWVEIVCSVGFPIAACAYMAWENHDARKEFTAHLKETEEKHDAEVDALTEVVNNCTMAIQHLADTMRKD